MGSILLRFGRVGLRFRLIGTCLIHSGIIITPFWVSLGSLWLPLASFGSLWATFVLFGIPFASLLAAFGSLLASLGFPCVSSASLLVDGGDHFARFVLLEI